MFWSASPALHAQINVLTYHNDNARTGQNTNESILTPSNVNSTQFGKLFSVTVDGYVYAQPLLVSNVNIPGQGTHNVVYVATENDSLYAIDGDNGSILWQVSFIDPSAGVTGVNGDDTFCGNISPRLGVTSTPVIDTGTGTIYLVAFTKENGAYIQRLHAIDIATHAEKFGGPVVIQATVPGTGTGSVNGSLSLTPLKSNQRAGLVLQNGHVIIAWGSYCDQSPYHGWVMSYNAASLAQESVLPITPNGSGGGVWGGGGAPAVDANSNIYLATGNGDYDGISNFGDSILRVSGLGGASLAAADWFTPYDQANMNTKDLDLGSGGVLLLPDLPSGSAHTQLFVEAGKTGTMYLIDRNNMGQYCGSTCTSDTQIVQEIPSAVGPLRGMPAYWNGNIYLGGASDNLKAFSFNASNSGLLSTSPTSQSAVAFAFPGLTPSVSSSGNINGIVWVLDNATNKSSCCQVLHAYDATNLANELYNSSQAPNSRDVPGGAVKYTVPTIANGKVYVGSQATLTIYGLLPPAAATPTFSPVAGTYNAAQSVSISDSSAGTTIYYTTDGTTPTTASTVYTAPIAVNTTTTIQAIASGGSFSASAVGSATYTIQTAAATPAFSPVAGTYSSAQSVTISDTSAGTTIYYTTDGSTPTISSTVYTAPIAVSATTTIKAIASGGSFSASAIGSAAYTIQTAAATPTFSPVAGTYSAAQSVSISDSSAGTTIYYTTNGTAPTTASTVYTAPIAVSTTTTIKAIASGGSFSASAVGSATYTIQTAAAVPTFNPAAGTYSSPQSVSISDSSAGTTIYYTTNGTAPTTASTVYTAPIAVSTTTTIQAIASGGSFSASAVGSAAYTIQTAAATPTFSPAAGTYSSAQSVSISDTSAGTTIYYTTNGSTPTTASTVYTAPIAVSTTTTIKAIASGGSFSASAVGSATYTIQTGAATPTFSPVAGTYSAAQSVSISDTSAGTTIYYTTNGTTPTTASTVYTAPIAVSTTTTIKAIAAGGSFSASAVGSATYTIQPAAAVPTFNPVAGTYHSPQSVTISDSSAGVTIHYTTNGTTPTTASAVYTAPIAVNTTTTIKAIAAGGSFSASAVGSATYTIQTAAATPTFSPAGGTYHAKHSVTILDSSPGVTIHYTTNGTTPTTSSTVYTTAISVTTTTTLKAIAVGGGFTTSAVGTAIYKLTAATPNFKPVGGTYQSAQSVVIYDFTAGVTIHYTIDGTTPTTSSPVYTGAIAVSKTTTIKAMALGNGFSAGGVGTATYTIQ